LSDLNGAFWERYAADDVSVFGLSSGGETPEELAFFITEFQLNYPVLGDANATYWRYIQSGGTSPYPLDYIIDQAGKVAYFNTEYDPDRMTQVIDGLLGKSPDIRVEPGAIDFGPVQIGESAWSLLSIFNDGEGDLHIASIESDEAAFVANQDNMVLAPGTSQSLLVSFAPLDPGPQGAVLSLVSDDADESVLNIDLHGEGFQGTGVDYPVHPFALRQNRPNPFSIDTSIRFSLSRSGSASIILYDLQGRAVRRLGGRRVLEEGEHRAIWDGKDDRGRPLPSGVYFYKLRANGRERARKAILMR